MNAFEKNIALLESFSDQIDANVLFKAYTPNQLSKQREQLRTALDQLLVWQRPQLETAKGPDWPYRLFFDRHAYFVKILNTDSTGALKREALLFLALLPFPGQWQWLQQALHELHDLPELEMFKNKETQAIRAKLAQKRQKKFKLRHFCQILKRPQLPQEKGILRIFSLPYIFINEKLLQSLNRSYFLYIEPPMGVVFRHSWWRAFSSLADPCLFGVGGKEDADFLNSQSGIHTTSLAHGDYLEALNDPGSDRTDGKAPTLSDQSVHDAEEFDLVFNATFDDMPRKRHEFMLDLLTDPLLSDLSALFIGRGDATNIDSFQRALLKRKLQTRVTVRSNLKRSEIPQILSKCRVGVHLSLYENNCRSIYEFFRSDLPTVISSSMAGMNMHIFNSMTGMAVKESSMAQSIRDVYHNRSTYKPQTWFRKNSGSRHSTRKLNALLKELFHQMGYNWSEDIVQLTSSGANRYVSLEAYERFLPEFITLFEIITKNMPIPIQLTID